MSAFRNARRCRAGKHERSACANTTSRIEGQITSQRDRTMHAVREVVVEPKGNMMVDRVFFGIFNWEGLRVATKSKGKLNEGIEV